MKMLFISDNEQETTIVNNITKKEFSRISIINVKNSEEAFDKLTYEGPIALVIIDTHLKKDDPSEIAENILEMFGNRAIVFSGSQNMINTRVKQELYQNKDLAFLYEKPYQAESLKETLKKALSWVEEEQFENSVLELDASNFVQIKLRNFYLFNKIEFNAYIKLSENKFALALSANKVFSNSNVLGFQKRGIKYLYIQKNEHLEFLENSILKINNTLKSNNIPRRNLIQIQIAAAMVTHQYLKSIGISESIQEMVENLYCSILDVYKDILSFKSFILDFPIEHQDIPEQSILKIYFSLATCDGLSWKSEIGTRKLFLAGLIHDYSLNKESDSYITHLEHPEYLNMSDEEKESFKNHPTKATSFCSYFSGFNDVEFIIEQHHELPNGSGFPLKMNAGKLPPISCIFILNSNFVTQLIGLGITNTSFKNIFANFVKEYNLGNFKEPLKALQDKFYSKVNNS